MVGIPPHAVPPGLHKKSSPIGARPAWEELRGATPAYRISQESGAQAVPLNVEDCPQRAATLQIHSYTGMCQDYFNRFIFLQAYVNWPPEMVPGTPHDKVCKVISIIVGLPTYTEHLRKCLSENMDFDTLMEMAPDNVKSRIGKLDRTVKDLQRFVETISRTAPLEEAVKDIIRPVINEIGVLIFGEPDWRMRSQLNLF